MSVGEPAPLPTGGGARWGLHSGRRGWLGGMALLAVTALGGALTPARAIDNPDAPDRTAAFERRAQPLEERLGAAANATELTQASSAYARFLDAELNQAYQELLSQVPAGARAALVQSQRAWLRYRDAEAAFIDRHWTREAFGSSSALSRADYRSTLVRQRVLTLLSYLRSYADKPR